MFRSTARLTGKALLATALVSSGPVFADEINFAGNMHGIAVRPGDNDMAPVIKPKHGPPWKIGMSHFGLSNTWTIQMAHEAEYEAGIHPEIGQFLLRNADLKQTKQVADIEDLIAQGVDALIVTPLTPTSADAGIEKAIKMGIPVVVHTGLTETKGYSTDLQGGGVHFGKVMGDYLVKELGGKGNIWVLRGVPSHPEDINRYKGLVEALKGTSIKITMEQYGNWEYDAAHKICENQFLADPNVQGIWSSGADMVRACIDVFQQNGVPIPPITGEGNNGFFRRWVELKLKSISPEYGPEQGAAGVRMALDLLEGKALHHRYIYEPAPITEANRDKYFRPDLSDNYWFPSSLPEELKKKYYGQ
jgi:ribose transport system substrate-binding protein